MSPRDKYLQQTSNNSGKKLLTKLNNQKMIDYYSQRGDQNLNIVPQQVGGVSN